jgi:hypothetical protein
MRYRKSSIHWVSACELRPSAASIAALYPRIACSLDTTPLVRGFSSRVGAQARHSVREAAHVYADERPLFCPGQLFFSTLHGSKKLGPFWRSKVWNASASGRMPSGPGRYRLPAARAAA